MAIEKVYPQLRCSACGGELESTEPETEYVFVLSVKPCKRCAAQQSVQATACAACGLWFVAQIAAPNAMPLARSFEQKGFANEKSICCHGDNWRI